MLDTDKGNLVLLTQDGRALRLVRAVGFPVADTQGWQQFSVDLPVRLADAVRSKEPVFVASLAELQSRYPLLSGRMFQESYSALLALPLLVGTRVLGAIGLAFTVARSFTDEEIAFLQIVAQQCAVAVERARLVEQERNAGRCYQNMLEMRPDAIMVHQDERIVFANNALVHLIGAQSESDLIGKHPLSLIHPDSLTLVKDRMARLQKLMKIREALGPLEQPRAIAGPPRPLPSCLRRSPATSGP